MIAKPKVEGQHSSRFLHEFGYNSSKRNRELILPNRDSNRENRNSNPWNRD
jgi:hypothetical protein